MVLCDFDWNLVVTPQHIIQRKILIIVLWSNYWKSISQIKWLFHSLNIMWYYVFFNTELYTAACFVFQVVQPVMRRRAALAEWTNIMLHIRQCTSHQVSENCTQPYQCLFPDSKQEQGPIVLSDPCRHIDDKKQVGFKERVILRVCYLMYVSENNLGLLPATVAI